MIEDAEHDSRRLFLHAKNNLAPAQQGLAFRLEQRLVDDGIVASRIIWDAEPVTITANEALAADAAGPEGRTARRRPLNSYKQRWPTSRCPAREIDGWRASTAQAPKPLGRPARPSG